ncbi:hypothetical protein [Aromatoleum evansii]|uniref:hypothetical protein n=1 Tax=Aromatoleum evansii TaxID=59406 RepID=UPI00145E1C65|nr:hypothetical protein [Aromatoleum evansii]NMG27975.1 hypothetical protein [Aromatoleum evansii]
MTKAIKFNLILDGHPVRNLDELRDNFNIEDILSSYRNGLLKRWLETRRLTEEIAELERIPDDDIDAAKALCRIFHGDATNKQIEIAAYPFAFRRREAERLERYENLEIKRKEIILAYHGNYTKLLSSIEERSGDYPFIKSAVAEIFSRYFELYILDARAFYERFIKSHPMVILATLANSDMRPHIAKELSQVKQDMSIAWPDPTLPHIQAFAGETEGYWKDLKPRGTRYLIIQMNDNNLIRNCGIHGEELKADDVNGKFPILDGIDYKSNSSVDKLIYMEV